MGCDDFAPGDGCSFVVDDRVSGCSALVSRILLYTVSVQFQGLAFDASRATGLKPNVEFQRNRGGSLKRLDDF